MTMLLMHAREIVPICCMTHLLWEDVPKLTLQAGTWLSRTPRQAAWLHDSCSQALEMPHQVKFEVVRCDIRIGGQGLFARIQWLHQSRRDDDDQLGLVFPKGRAAK